MAASQFSGGCGVDVARAWTISLKVVSDASLTRTSQVRAHVRVSVSVRQVPVLTFQSASSRHDYSSQPHERAACRVMIRLS